MDREKGRHEGNGGRVPIVAIAVTTTLTLCISLYCLSSGVVTIFQNLFYVPIIIACVYYPRKGFVYSACLALLYLAMMCGFAETPIVIRDALIRVFIFVGIAGVITFLSIKRQRVEAELRQHRDMLETAVESRTNELRASAEQAKRLKQQIEFVLGATNTGLAIIEPGAGFAVCYVDPAGQARKGDPAGQPCHRYLMGRENVCLECDAELCVETRKMRVRECTLAAEGNRPVQVTTIPFQDDRGQWLVAEVSLDITERRRSEDHAAKRLKELRVLYRLAEICERQGISLDEIYLKSARIIPSGWQYPEMACARITTGGREFRSPDFAPTQWMQTAPIRVNGTVAGCVDVAYRNEMPHEDEGPFLHEERLVLDTIAERLGRVRAHKEAEEALRASESRFRAIVDNTGLGMCLIGVDMEVLEMNRRMRAWFPSPDIETGILCYQRFATPPATVPCEGCASALTLLDGNVHESRRQTPPEMGGRTYRLVSSPVRDAHGTVSAVIQIVEDITDRLSLEAQLHQAQKMEAVGQLAGGVAHDFNNILQAIIGYGSILQAALKEHAELHEYVQEIVDGAGRATALTRQLLAFSRRQVLQMTDLDLNEVIGDMMKMIRRLIGENVRVETLEGGGLGTLHADRGQMEQVLLNLCVNARDAMPGGGALTIETAGVEMTPEYCETHTWALPGKYAVLSVTDTGCGMDPQTRARIFEPFFTTKAPGKGTGLGLATVYGIVRQHQGMIQVYSEVGRGTTFRVYLPSSGGAHADAGPPPAEAVEGGTETILLAEDDETLRKLAARILCAAGYNVYLATDGRHAVELFEQHEGRIDLVVSDLVMPDLGGEGLYDALHTKHEAVRFLFSSGYSANVLQVDSILKKGVELIQKPYAPDVLLRKVREVLDRPSPAPDRVFEGAECVHGEPPPCELEQSPRDSGGKPGCLPVGETGGQGARSQ